MAERVVLCEAKFDRAAIKKYSVVQPIIPLVCTVVMIPIVPVIVVLIMAFIDRHLDRLSCVLTEQSLELKRGIFNRVESTIPLGKITDLHMYQGPVMRFFGIHGLRVETAGQAMGAGAIMTIVGVIDTPAFRKAVLEQRDRLERGTPESHGPAGGGSHAEGVLLEIRDSLLRIEERLGRGGS